MPYLLSTLKLRFPSHCIVRIIIAALVPILLALHVLVLFANANCINYPLPDVCGGCVSGIMSADISRWGMHVLCWHALVRM